MHEFYSTWAWGVGIVVGFSLVVLFLVNARTALLFYVLIMPVLQPLMTAVVTIPGSTGTVALGGPLLTIVLLASLCAVVRSNIRSLRVPVVSIFLILWLVMGISIVESPDKIAAIKEWGRIGSFVFIYILSGLTFRGEKDIVRFVKILFLSVLVPLILGVYQFVAHAGFLHGIQLPEHYNRIMGTYGNPVEFAMYLAFPLLLCITMAMDNKMRAELRFFFLLGVVALPPFLFLTYTRSSWFGIMAGLLFIGVRRHKSLLLAVPLLVLLVLMTVPLGSIRLGEFTTGRLTFSGRVGGWTLMLPLVKDYPILGHGLTSFGHVTTQSDHVRLLLETGFLGWTVFLYLIWTLFKALNRAYGSLQAGVEKNFSLAYLSFFVCIVVMGFSETNAIFQYYVWIPAGMVLANNIRGSKKGVDASGTLDTFRGSSSLAATGLLADDRYNSSRTRSFKPERWGMM